MRQFFKNESGIGAVEFALIAPFLAIFVLGIMSGADYYQQKRQMRDAVEAAGKYYLQGGSDDASARTIALNAWQNRSTDATVTTAETCSCAATTVSCDSASVCSSGNVSQIHKTITASATRIRTYSNPLSIVYNTYARSASIDHLTETQVVRVR